MRKTVFLIILLFPALVLAEKTITLDGGVSGLTSNSLIDIAHDSSSVWLGTGGGASVTTDSGAHWTTYKTPTLPQDEVSALAVNNHGVWVSSSRSEVRNSESIPIGSGISLTVDGGLTWQTFSPRQATWYGELAYDLAAYDTIAFASCFYGGLIRTTDKGQTWQNLFPSQLDSINSDSVDYYLNNFNRYSNRMFSVQVDTIGFPDTFSVWAGSAAGIYQFFFVDHDTLPGPRHYPTYPDSIARYFREDTLVVDSLKLPGNFVVALGIQKFGSTKTIWAGCRPANSGYMQVAFSQDGGHNWHTADIGGLTSSVEAWDFAFASDTVYVATNSGLFRSSGDYSTWVLMSGFRDPAHQTFYQDNAPFYSVDIVDGTLWAGGTDGLIKSEAGGGWQVFRSSRDAVNHYAYPSPFSPHNSTRRGTTIHFMPTSTTTATVKVLDRNLDLVKTVASDIQRLGGVESDDIVWDGRNEKGDLVANGIYYYRILLGTGEDLWGKIVVIK